jgi:hypothetical protein
MPAPYKAIFIFPTSNLFATVFEYWQFAPKRFTIFSVSAEASQHYGDPKASYIMVFGLVLTSYVDS